MDEWEGSDGVEGDFEIEPEQDNYSNQMEQMLSHLNEESVIKGKNNYDEKNLFKKILLIMTNNLKL